PSRSAARLDLPSFPTRRSSDLVFTVRRHRRGTHPSKVSYALVLRADIQRVPGRSPTRRRCRKYHRRMTYPGGDGPRIRVAVIDEDRKSTRLNSSHVKISYAVFC